MNNRSTEEDVALLDNALLSILEVSTAFGLIRLSFGVFTDNACAKPSTHK